MTSSGVSWDDRYSAETFAFGTEPNDFLRECMATDILANGHLDIFCIGDGEGRNGVYLATKGHKVTTIDLSPVGVAKANTLAATNGVSINAMVGDLDVYEMGVSNFDAVISIFCHMPKELRARVHSKIEKALRPKGVLLIEAYRPENVGRGVGGPQFPNLCLQVSEVKSQFPGFEFLIAREVERNIAEGQFHNGYSATTQIFATKGEAHI